MLERNKDLAAIAGYSVLAAGAVRVLHPFGAGGLLLTPLLFVCPGYALVRAIEGRRRPDALELAVTTVALSFATAALGGLVLNTLDIGLTARTWSILFLIVTVPATAVAARRRVGADEGARQLLIRIHVTPLLAAGIICVLLSAAAVIAVRSQEAQDRRTSTVALSVARSNGGSTLRISVLNAASGPRRYWVRINVGNRRTTGFSLALASDEPWSGVRRIARSSAGPLSVELFAATQSTRPIRTVILSLPRESSNA